MQTNLHFKNRLYAVGTIETDSAGVQPVFLQHGSRRPVPQTLRADRTASGESIHGADGNICL